ncbi:MAG: hypothetical protein KAR06_12290 [Deltaproteobacteria bacterium]|nr:hypothetical protein [Deltaproteobacteria bacterium]
MKNYLKRLDLHNTKITSAILVFTALVLTANHAFAAYKTVKTIDSIKASIIVSPKMVDVYIKDVDTNKVITDATAKVLVTYPSGKEVEVKLMGMKMGEIYSYMNSTELTESGTYKLTIEITRAEKTTTFDVEATLK